MPRLKEFAACVLAMAVVLHAVGCDLLSGETPNTETPDPAALTQVIEEVYRTQSDRSILFLGTETELIDELVLAAVMAGLQQRLGTEVCPQWMADLVHPDYPLFTPVLAETGEPGVIICIVGLEPVAAGIWRMQMFVSQSCSERWKVECQIAWNGADWLVVGTWIEPDEMGCY
jgi:hypothetical protein